MTHLICIGDCHFGARGNNADRYAALDHIVDYGRRLPELGAWLLAGDLNDAKMTIADRNLLAERLQDMAECAPVLGVRGNHDVEGDLAIFERMEARHPIRFIESAQVVPLELATGAVASVFCLPYVFKGALVGAGVDQSELGRVARGLLEPVFIQAAAQLEDGRGEGRFPLMLGHINVGGSLTSAGQPNVGREIELDPALLARLDGMPRILGHIHKPQEIHGAVYLGSITRNDFGEREEKSFGLIVADPSGDWSFVRVPLRTPAMVHVDGRLTRDGFTVDSVDGEHVSRDPGDDGLVLVGGDFSGADVRVRFEQKKADVGVLDIGLIERDEVLRGCRSLKLDPVTVLEHTVRAPEIAAAVTLTEKALAYAKRQGITVTPGFEQKLAALQRPEPTALLTDVVAALKTAGEVPDTDPTPLAVPA